MTACTRRVVAALLALCCAQPLIAAAQPVAERGDEVTAGTSAAAVTANAYDCRPDPLAGRTLYLRGTFNSWNAVETQKFTWACSRWELVTRIQGEHVFKLGDEGWNADADFGGPAMADAGSLRLLPKGPEIRRRFDGVHRLTVVMTDTTPTLAIEPCPHPAPHGSTLLFMRGTMNNWAALDAFAFQYSCDAYYLNVKLNGRHEFKIADAAWAPATSFGSTPDNRGNFVIDFDGEATVRVGFVAGRVQLGIGPKTFADPSAVSVTDPVALSLRFNSRDLAHKRPFGAVPAGTQIEYAVTALPGVEALTLVLERRRLEGNQEVLEYIETGRVPMQKAAASGDGTERWTANHRFDAVAIHGWWFEAVIAGKKYALQNNTDAIYWTREKGSNGVAAVGEMPALASSIRRFRQTVHQPGMAVPDWAPDIVYYYIFPERYRNGNPRNDPRPGRDKYRAYGIEKHADWLDRPYKPGTGDGSDTHFNNDFFGGDLAGIIEKLDDIKDLGANTIYMTPVFQAASNHKYDTADFKRIDPAFGTNADFVRLTREAAKRGIRIIADTSLNHTGSDSLYFNRYGNYQSRGAFQNGRPDPKSPYFGWYRFDLTQTEADRQYTGWVGVTDLPEIDKSSPAWRQFAYGAKDSVMKLWLDRGAAGWRMDVAPWVPDDFWREWRTAVKAHKPDALTVAETWFDASKYFLGDMFDSTMNYIFRNAVLDWAAGGKAQTLVVNLELMREAYPKPALFAAMNLLSTHDQARSLHHFGWSTEHGNLRDAAAETRAKQRLKLALLFQMSYPGAPTVYYGDEVGVTGGDDPYNRATYPWPDRGGQPDLALRAEFKRLIALRHAHPVLRRGELLAPLHVDDHVVVLARRLDSAAAGAVGVAAGAAAAPPTPRAAWAVTATNNSEQPRRVRVRLPAAAPAAWVDALTGTGARADGDMLDFEVPALSGVVWLPR